MKKLKIRGTLRGCLMSVSKLKICFLKTKNYCLETLIKHPLNVPLN